MSNENDTVDEGLVRAIGTPALGLNIMNMVVGAGIFVLPGIIAVRLGPAAIFAYLVCSFAVALVFLCFAEVGSRITRSGGAYAYIEEAFGQFAGFVASTLFWFGWSMLSEAAIAIAMVETLSIAFPVLQGTVARSVFIIVLFAFLAGVNITGVKSGMRMVIFNTLAKLLPLLLLLAVGIFAINFENLVVPEFPPMADLGAAALILFFAFAGAESALSASGEIKNPARTVPVGLLLGLTGILCLYVGLQTVAQGVLGAELADNTEAPLAAAASAVFGEWGSQMLVVAGVISIFATLSGDLLCAPRVVYASALDGNLPKFLTRIHPKYKTPHVAIGTFAAMACAIALSGSFEPLAVVASGSILVIYAGVSLAVIRLRQRDGDPRPGQFKLPGGPLIPLMSFSFVGWLLWQLTPEEAKGLGALVAIVAGLYALRVLVQRTMSPKKGPAETS